MYKKSPPCFSISRNSGSGSGNVQWVIHQIDLCLQFLVPTIIPNQSSGSAVKGSPFVVNWWGFLGQNSEGK